MKAFKKLSTRIVMSVVILSSVYTAIVYSPALLYVAINSLVIGYTLYEFYSMLHKTGLRPRRVIGIALGMLFPLFIYFPGEVLVFSAALMSLMFVNFSDNEDEKYSCLINTGVTLTGLLYIGWFLSFFTKIRFLDNGAMWVCYLIAVPKICDAGAYFVGTGLGRNRPFKSISPNKSIEGFAGGFLFSILGSLLFKLLIPGVAWIHFAVLGLLLAIIGQMGDLTESLIKRECDVKDSGELPGLGGSLDILDSLLFCAPFLYYYLNAFIIG